MYRLVKKYARILIITINALIALIIYYDLAVVFLISSAVGADSAN
jgi:hypothetical protein